MDYLVPEEIGLLFCLIFTLTFGARNSYYYSYYRRGNQSLDKFKSLSKSMKLLKSWERVDTTHLSAEWEGDGGRGQKKKKILLVRPQQNMVTGWEKQIKVMEDSKFTLWSEAWRTRSVLSLMKIGKRPSIGQNRDTDTQSCFKTEAFDHCSVKYYRESMEKKN